MIDFTNQDFIKYINEKHVHNKDTLYVIPTRYLCNKKCSFCITKRQFPEVSDYPEFLKIDDLLKHEDEFKFYFKYLSHASRIEITGGGEPSLNPDISEIIEYFKQFNKNISLYTNGIKIINLKSPISTINLSTSVYDLFNHDSEFTRKTFNTLLNASEFYKDFCQNLRIRIFVDEDYLKKVDNFEFKLMLYRELIHKINPYKVVFAKDFNSANKLKSGSELIQEVCFKDFASYSMPKYIMLQDINIRTKFDNSEKKCMEYPLIYTDSRIHDTWYEVANKDLKSENKNQETENDNTLQGYHLSKIEKGEYGTSKKILEEVLELIDSENQSKVMCLIELSDILGAIEGYLNKNFKDIVTFQDLLDMKDITKRVFENGIRK